MYNMRYYGYGVCLFPGTRAVYNKQIFYQDSRHEPAEWSVTAFVLCALGVLQAPFRPLSIMQLPYIIAKVFSRMNDTK